MGSGSSTSSTTETVKPTAAIVINSDSTTSGEKKAPCKACCACPETKKARDQW